MSPVVFGLLAGLAVALIMRGRYWLRRAAQTRRAIRQMEKLMEEGYGGHKNH